MGILDRINPHFAKVRTVDFAALEARLAEGLTMMGWADPFYPDPCIPAHVVEATHRAIDRGQTHYAMPIGSADLRRAIAAKLRRFNGLEVDPDREVIVTPGSDAGLYYAMQILLSPGDEVLNPEPSYSSNHVNAGLLGAVSVRVPLCEESGYQIQISALEQHLTDRTRLVVLTQPNNPTSTVQSRRSLQELSRFVIANDLFVVADHAFEDIVFDDLELVTIASLPGMWERTISVFSTSKGMGLSGFRVGYNVACAELMAVMHGAAVNVLGTANTFAQAGALAAFEDSGFVDEFKRVFDRRRRRAMEVFDSVPGVQCRLPESGFNLWLNIAALGTSADVTARLRAEARVIVSAGTNYGPGGEGYIRITLGALREESAFEDALARIASTLRGSPAAGLAPQT